MINDGPISSPVQPEVPNAPPKAPPIAPPMGQAKATRFIDRNITAETRTEINRLTLIAKELTEKINTGDTKAALEYDKYRKTYKDKINQNTNSLNTIEVELEKLNANLKTQIDLIPKETKIFESRFAELSTQTRNLEKQKEHFSKLSRKGIEIAIKKIDEKLISLENQHTHLNKELEVTKNTIETNKNKITDEITQAKRKQNELMKQKAQLYALSNVFLANKDKNDKKDKKDKKAQESKKVEVTVNFKEWIEKGPLDGIYLENLKTFFKLTTTEEVIARCTELVNEVKRKSLGLPPLIIEQILAIAAGYITRPEEKKYINANPLWDSFNDEEVKVLFDMLKEDFYNAHPEFNQDFVPPATINKITAPSLNDDKEITVPDTNPSTIQNNQEDPITIKQPPLQKNESNTIEITFRNTVDTSQSQSQLSNVLLRDMQLARAELRNVMNVIGELDSNMKDDNTALSDDQLLQQALMKLQSFKITIEEERAQLKHKFEDLTQELGHTKHQMQQQIDQTQQEINNTKQAWAETQRELTQTKEQFSKNKQEWTEKLDQTKHSSFKTQQQLTLSKFNLDIIQKELGQKKLTLGQAQQELNETTQKLDQTKFQLGSTQQELDLKQQELKQNKQQLDHTQQELNQAKLQQSQTLLELNQFKQQWSQTQQELNQTKLQQSQTLQDLNQAKQQQSQTLQDLNQAKQQQSQTLQELNQFKQQWSQTQQELNQTKQQWSQTQQELNQTKLQQSQTLQDLNQAKQQWSQTQQELNQTKQQWSQTQQELNQTKQQWSQTQQELNQTKQQQSQTLQELNQAKQHGFQIQQELKQTQQGWVHTQQELNLNQQHLSQMQQQFNQTQLQLGKTQHVATQTKQELTQTKEQLVEALKLSPQQILEKEGLQGLGHAIFVYKKENRDAMPTASILNQWGMAKGLIRDPSWRPMISQAAVLVKQYEDSIKNTPTQPQPARPQALSPAPQQKPREEQDIFIKLNKLLDASNNELDGLDQLVKIGYADVLPLLMQKQNERDSLKMSILTEEMKNLNELIKNGSKEMIPLLNQKQQEQNWLANEIKKRKI